MTTPWYSKMPIWAWIVSGLGLLGVLCCAGLGVVAALSPTQPQAQPTQARTTAPAATTAPPTTPASTPLDASLGDDPASGWAAFASSGAVPPSVLAVVDLVRWDGVALVAETSIVNDGDAPEIAGKVCSAVSAYGLTGGGFRPVQVLGSAGDLLVSRHSLGEQCTWRG